MAKNENAVENKTVEKENEAFIPGNYTCDYPVQVIKKLETRNKYNKDGSIARTYGTWTKPDNFYYFKPKQKTVLSKEDLKNPSLQNLILDGKIYRTL